MKLLRARLATGALLLLGSGCDTGDAAQPGRTLEGPSSSSVQGEAGTPGGQGDGAAIANGLPCDIEAIVRGRCQGCHSDPPQSGAPMPLVTRTNLLATAKSDATKVVAQLALDRTTSATSPMPPYGPRVPDAETAALSAWIKAGFPAGTCSDPASVVDAGPNPFNTPVVCTSGTYWNQADKKDPRMHPGGACLTCHAQRPDAPRLLAGGTV